MDLNELRSAIEDVVRQLVKETGSDETQFMRRARQLLTQIGSMENVKSSGPLQALRDWVGSQNIEAALHVFHVTRQQIVFDSATASVPIVAAVFNISLIWETGHRLDHVVVPGASAKDGGLKLSELSRHIPQVCNDILQTIAETGIDQTRRDSAYLMDREKHDELLGVLGDYIEKLPVEVRADYGLIVERVRMSLQVLSEGDLRTM